MLNTLTLTGFIFLDILELFIFAHIILSFLTLIGVHIRFRFLDMVVLPMYNGVKRVIPTTIWIFDLAPLVVLIILSFCKWLLMTLNPNMIDIIRSLWF